MSEFDILSLSIPFAIEMPVVIEEVIEEEPVADLYKLHYFDAYGRGDVIRSMLNRAGVQYKNHTFSMEEWFAIKPTMPNG